MLLKLSQSYSKFLKVEFAAPISWIFLILWYSSNPFRKIQFVSNMYLDLVHLDENQRSKLIVRSKNDEINKSTVFGIFHPQLLLKLFWSVFDMNLRHVETFCSTFQILQFST